MRRKQARCLVPPDLSRLQLTDADDLGCVFLKLGDLCIRSCVGHIRRHDIVYGQVVERDDSLLSRPPSRAFRVD